MWCNAITHREEGGAAGGGGLFPRARMKPALFTSKEQIKQRSVGCLVAWLVGWLLRLDSFCSATAATGRERENEREKERELLVPQLAAGGKKSILRSLASSLPRRNVTVSHSSLMFSPFFFFFAHSARGRDDFKLQHERQLSHPHLPLVGAELSQNIYSCSLSLGFSVQASSPAVKNRSSALFPRSDLFFLDKRQLRKALLLLLST